MCIYIERMKALLEDEPVEDYNLEDKPVEDSIHMGEDAELAAHDPQQMSDFEVNLLWYEMVRVHKAARECQNNSSTEANWNCEVHTPLFRLALEPTRIKKDHVRYENVTTN